VGGGGGGGGMVWEGRGELVCGGEGQELWGQPGVKSMGGEHFP